MFQPCHLPHIPGCKGGMSGEGSRRIVCGLLPFGAFLPMQLGMCKDQLGPKTAWDWESPAPSFTTPCQDFLSSMGHGESRPFMLCKHWSFRPFLSMYFNQVQFGQESSFTASGTLASGLSYPENRKRGKETEQAGSLVEEATPVFKRLGGGNSCSNTDLQIR